MHSCCKAAATARGVVEDDEEERQALDEEAREKQTYRALPAGIQHFTWKVPLSGSHAAGLSAALDLLRPQAALVFVCPNAGETVKSVVQERFKRFARVMGSDKRRLHLEPRDLQTAGWSGADALTRLLFPDSRTVSGKASKQRGEAKGWRSANRLLDVRETTRRGYIDEGDFYREAPIFVSAEESVRGLHLDAVEAVFILGLPKNGASYVHMAGKSERICAVGCGIVLGAKVCLARMPVQARTCSRTHSYTCCSLIYKAFQVIQQVASNLDVNVACCTECT
eukprot:s1809_g10.t1